MFSFLLVCFLTEQSTVSIDNYLSIVCVLHNKQKNVKTCKRRIMMYVYLQFALNLTAPIILSLYRNVNNKSPLSLTN